MNIADIALNPMTSGSGSNLKIGDYFANKIPVITTPFGARGYKIENKKHAVICDLVKFKANLKSLLFDKSLQNQLKQNGYDYVAKELNWKVLAKKLDNTITQMYKKKNF